MHKIVFRSVRRRSFRDIRSGGRLVIVLHAGRIGRRRRNVQAHSVMGRNVVLSRHFRPARHELVSVDVVLYGLVVAGKRKEHEGK